MPKLCHCPTCNEPDPCCEHGIPIDCPCLECNVLAEELEVEWRKDGDAADLERKGGGAAVGGDTDDGTAVGA
jgi:hypothetical protein